jgi:hypothetical protein
MHNALVGELRETRAELVGQVPYQGSKSRAAHNRGRGTSALIRQRRRTTIDGNR